MQRKRSVIEIRRQNARALLAEVGTDEFCERAGIRNRQYLSQLCGPNPTRNIGNVKARQIERGFEKPGYWLDDPHEHEFGPPLPPQALQRLRQQLGRARTLMQQLGALIEDIERTLKGGSLCSLLAMVL